MFEILCRFILVHLQKTELVSKGIFHRGGEENKENKENKEKQGKEKQERTGKEETKGEMRPRGWRR